MKDLRDSPIRCSIESYSLIQHVPRHYLSGNMGRYVSLKYRLKQARGSIEVMSPRLEEKQTTSGFTQRPQNSLISVLAGDEGSKASHVVSWKLGQMCCDGHSCC
jgi:hypothetical protein